MRKSKLEEINNKIKKLSTKYIEEIKQDDNYITIIPYKVTLNNDMVIFREKIMKGGADGSSVAILPILKDTAVSNDIKRAEVTDIAYFEDSESYTYMLVAGFNINKNEQAYTEIFFGASDTVYASQNNLYIAQSNYGRFYNSSESKTTIYKFNLKF